MDTNPNTAPIKLELSSPFFRLFERTNFAPRVFTSLEEVFQTKSDSHIRSLAPYVLEVHKGDDKFYFQYAAAICKKQYDQTNSELLALFQSLPYTVQRQITKHIQVPDKVICVVFDVQPDNHLISYGGYFEVKPQALFRYLGQTNSAVREIKDTSAKCLNKSQLGILGMANKVLASFNEYYVNGEFAKVFFLSNNRTRNYLMSKDSKHVLCEEDEILIVDDDDDDEPPAAAGSSAEITNQTVPSHQESHPLQNRQLNDSDDPVVVTVISASSRTKDLKNRTQIVYSQSDLMEVSEAISERSLFKHLLTTAEAFARYGSTAMMSEFSCRDLIFCPTKYYAGIEGYGDKYFFQRVFIIGHVDDRAIVLPYSNGKEKRDLILQSPFATRVVFQRFEGDERTEADIVQKVNVANLSLQQVHIPTFVPAHDAARILRYWSSCCHFLTTHPHLIRYKLDPLLSPTLDFPGTSPTARKRIFEEKEHEHSTEPASVEPLRIVKSPQPNFDVTTQKTIAQVPEEISIGSDQSGWISSSSTLGISNRSVVTPPTGEITSSKGLLQARIDEYFPFDFQNSLYHFPHDWTDPHAVNTLFCENLLRNVVQCCLRVCLGLNSARDYTFFIPDQCMYGFTPLKFLEFAPPFFCISENDTFICHLLTKIGNCESSKFCKQVTFKNLYSHIIRNHLKLPNCRMPESNTTITSFSDRSMDLLPFRLSPGTVTPKPENPVTIRKLQRLNVILANQKAQGIGFFKTIEEAKVKKLLLSQEKTSSSKKNAQANLSNFSNRDSVISQDQGNSVQPATQESSLGDAVEQLDVKQERNDAVKRRLSNSDASFEEKIDEKEDIGTNSGGGCSEQSTNDECLILQSVNDSSVEEGDTSETREGKDEESEHCELVDQFIPMREVHDTLNSFITDWTKAYIGNTEYVAECPLLEEKETRRFFPNVIILGTHADYFFVMPLKNDVLSCKMRLGLPFATQKIFSRKNRHMPMVKVGDVVLQLTESVKQRMSVEEFEKCVKFQQLFSLGPVSAQLKVYNKCELLIST